MKTSNTNNPVNRAFREFDERKTRYHSLYDESMGEDAVEDLLMQAVEEIQVFIIVNAAIRYVNNKDEDFDWNEICVEATKQFYVMFDRLIEIVKSHTEMMIKVIEEAEKMFCADTDNPIKSAFETFDQQKQFLHKKYDSQFGEEYITGLIQEARGQLLERILNRAVDMTFETGNQEPNWEEVASKEVENAKATIINVLEDALFENWFSGDNNGSFTIRTQL